MASAESIRALMSLFRGRTDAWGSVEGRCNKEKVTRKHYESHLDGKTSLGVYMLQDDNTCWFFALDYDEHNTHKILALRQAFRNAGFPVYMAASKSKGYHLYGFAEKEPFIAKDIRRLCHGILAKLDVQCEMFPKQDTLDEVTPFGNYINLPCFGHTRELLKGDLKSLSLDEAAKQIKRIPKNKIVEFIKNLPPLVQPRVKRVKGGAKKGKHPPCITEIMKGVAQPGRDIAAFALARHFLDQYYTEEEVLGLLLTWDKSNRPPLNDLHLLQTKVRSAAKGYAFGCSSVTQDPHLSAYCIGEANCGWLQAITKEQLKKGLIREQSFHESETHLYEEIIQEGKPVFIAFEKKTGNISYLSSIDYPNFRIVPIHSAEITEGAVTLPTGVEDYGSALALVEEIKKFIYSYVDLPDIWQELSTWYIMMAWIYDRLNTISYLRFQGDTGCGKSRALDVIGRLCYKPLMMAGAVTPAPIYREIRRFRGTVILEEADFKDTTEKGEVITILNCGFERNRPVIRCSRDNPDNLEILPCFGPKVFATRFKFNDIALEARCLTHVMEETDREDISPLLGSKFFIRIGNLRNKLLLWRLKNLNSIDPDAVEEIEIAGDNYLEPRLKQLGLPFAIPFKDQPDVLERFKDFLRIYQAEKIEERYESTQGRVVTGLFKMADLHGKNMVSSSTIVNCLTEDFKMEIKSGTVGKILKSLHVVTSNRRVAGTRARYLKWDDKLMRKLLRRYMPSEEIKEYEPLFEEESIDMEV